jgi:hypothetical protein
MPMSWTETEPAQMASTTAPTATRPPVATGLLSFPAWPDPAPLAYCDLAQSYLRPDYSTARLEPKARKAAKVLREGKR